MSEKHGLVRMVSVVAEKWERPRFKISDRYLLHTEVWLAIFGTEWFVCTAPGLETKTHVRDAMQWAWTSDCTGPADGQRYIAQAC